MKALLVLFFAAAMLNPTFASDGTGKKAKEDKSAVVTGKILDEANAEALTGARLFIHELDKEFYANFDGEFNIEGIEPGTYTITVSYISYQEVTYQGFKIPSGSSYKKFYLHAS